MAASKMWENSQDSDIAIAILELFHLLPNPAVKYLETSQVFKMVCSCSFEGSDMHAKWRMCRP